MRNPVEDTAGQQAVLLLEQDERRNRIGAEDPVRLAGQITQFLQPRLQDDDTLPFVAFFQFTRERHSLCGHDRGKACQRDGKCQDKDDHEHCRPVV